MRPKLKVGAGVIARSGRRYGRWFVALSVTGGAPRDNGLYRLVSGYTQFWPGENKNIQQRTANAQQPVKAGRRLGQARGAVVKAEGRRLATLLRRGRPRSGLLGAWEGLRWKVKGGRKADRVDGQDPLPIRRRK